MTHSGRPASDWPPESEHNEERIDCRKGTRQHERKYHYRKLRGTQRSLPDFDHAASEAEAALAETLCEFQVSITRMDAGKAAAEIEKREKAQSMAAQYGETDPRLGQDLFHDKSIIAFDISFSCNKPTDVYFDRKKMN